MRKKIILSTPTKKRNISERKKKITIFPNLSLQDIQKDLITTLSGNLENNWTKETRKPKDFPTYIKTMENSMTKYQLNYNKKPNERFLNKKDTLLIKKICSLNKILVNKGLASHNEDSNMKVLIERLEYPNPYESLGIIKHNNYIFNKISKDFLYRQTDLFKEQFNYIKKTQNLLKAKMPQLHISGASSKTNFEIPVVDLTEEKEKKGGGSGGVSVLPHEGGLRLFSYYRYPNKNFPEGKEQFSMYQRDKEVIICGGLSASMRGMTFWSLDLEKLEWAKIAQKIHINNRFGHSSVIYQNKIFIFGGRTKFGSGFVSMGLEIISLTDNTYSNQDPEGNIFPEPRKNHICELINNQMLIYGGINETNEILNDCYYLTLSPLKWGIGFIHKNFIGPKVYGHTSCVVLPKEYYSSHKLSIYSFPEMELPNSRIKEKGLYIFGGKTKEEGGLSNKMWVLQMGQKPMRWINLETKGKPPSPRYFHSMNYYEKGNFIIIHGGRNDVVSDSSALADTFVFDLENFEWMKVELYSQLKNFKVLSRCGHQSIIYCNKLIILGGMNNKNYIGSSLLIVNLDFSYSNSQKSIEEIMIRELENKNDVESKKKLLKYKNDLKKNQLGLVTTIALPEIK